MHNRVAVGATCAIHVEVEIQAAVARLVVYTENFKSVRGKRALIDCRDNKGCQVTRLPVELGTALLPTPMTVTRCATVLTCPHKCHCDLACARVLDFVCRRVGNR